MRDRIIARVEENEREELEKEEEIEKRVKERTLAAGKKYRPKVSERELSAIIAAYHEGHEVRMYTAIHRDYTTHYLHAQKLRVWRMECVGFDEALLKNLASKL